MGYLNQENCYEQTIFDHFDHFKKKMKKGEIKALKWANKLAQKAGNPKLQAAYQDHIDRKLGLNTVDIEIDPKDFHRLISPLSNDSNSKNMMTTAQLLNPQGGSAGSHIFKVQIDKESGSMKHNNFDGSKLLFSSDELKRLQDTFSRSIIQFKSDILTVKELTLKVQELMKEAEIQYETRYTRTSKDSSILAYFLAENKGGNK